MESELVAALLRNVMLDCWKRIPIHYIDLDADIQGLPELFRRRLGHLVGKGRVDCIFGFCLILVVSSNLRNIAMHVDSLVVLTTDLAIGLA